MSRICVALSILVILFDVHTFVLSKKQNYDICRNSNGHRIYLEYGENGSLEARNLVAYNNGSNIRHECSLEIVTCPSCLIFVRFGFFNLSQTCNDKNNSKIDVECEYIEILEHPYEDLSVRKFYGESKNNVIIKTQTKNIIIKLFYIYNNVHAFKAEYRSQRNRQFLSGAPVFNIEN
ncbi:CUB and LDLa domain [Carabus blaptoides fortunei]